MAERFWIFHNGTTYSKGKLVLTLGISAWPQQVKLKVSLPAEAFLPPPPASPRDRAFGPWFHDRLWMVYDPGLGNQCEILSL